MKPFMKLCDMKKLLFVFLFPVLVFGCANAQEKEKKKKKDRKRHIATGLLFTSDNVRDEGMSLVRYGGAAIGLSIALEERYEKRIERLCFTGSYGFLNSVYFDENDLGYASNARFEIDYLYLRRFRPLGNWRSYLGGTLNLMTALRLKSPITNSSLNYDSFNTLGIAGALERDFTALNERQFRFIQQVRVPLAGFGLRQTFTNVSNFIDREESFVSESADLHGWMSFGSFGRIILKSEIAYILENGNMFRMGYGWDYYEYNKIHRVQAARHTFSFSALLAF